MKILVAYDGTPGSDAALDDLARAGLPSDAEAMVLTVAEASVALAGMRPALLGADDEPPAPTRRQQLAAAALDHARDVAAAAAARLRERFPGWSVSPDAWGGSPASAIVLKSDLWQPDLVVLGSRGLGRAGRMLLGSVARKVVTEARCSVRVGRAATADAAAPRRILVGHDGGGAGQAALLAAAARAWPQGSQIRVLAVHTPPVHAGLGPSVGGVDPWPADEMPFERSVLRTALDQDAERARRPGLAVVADIAGGAPAGVLVRTARRWKADCVFMGATSGSRAARFLLGSVSAAVADRAHCSVEVVRARAG